MFGRSSQPGARAGATKPKTVWRGNDKIVSDLRIADTFFARLAGLGFIRDFPTGHGLLLEPCNSVHTFWPAFAIDVVFLSADRRIVRLCPELAHMRLSPVVWAANSVLELPAGTIRNFGLAPGQILTFE